MGEARHQDPGRASDFPRVIPLFPLSPPFKHDPKSSNPNTESEWAKKPLAVFNFSDTGTTSLLALRGGWTLQERRDPLCLDLPGP